VPNICIQIHAIKDQSVTTYDKFMKSPDEPASWAQSVYCSDYESQTAAVGIYSEIGSTMQSPLLEISFLFP